MVNTTRDLQVTMLCSSFYCFTTKTDRIEGCKSGPLTENLTSTPLNSRAVFKAMKRNNRKPLHTVNTAALFHVNSWNRRLFGLRKHQQIFRLQTLPDCTPPSIIQCYSCEECPNKTNCTQDAEYVMTCPPMILGGIPPGTRSTSEPERNKQPNAQITWFYL